MDPERAEYLEHLWWSMHHSESETRQSVFVTCYVDESSTDDLVLPDGVLGAVVLNKSGFLHFDPAWSDLLTRYGVPPPLHMKERDLKLGHLNLRARECFLREAVALIQEFKIASFAVTCGNRVFEECLHEAVRKQYSVYAICFIALVVVNHKNTEQQNFREPVAYMFDEGNDKKYQVLRAHSALKEAGNAFGDLRLGPIAFEYDTFVTALQAGDLVAWTKRRVLSKLPLPKGFDPLMEILNDAENHRDIEVTAGILTRLNTALMGRLSGEADGNAVV